MTLTENFLHDAIELDRNAEVMFGSDQIYDTCPCHFPTVEFQLTATDALVEVADRIRMEKGYLPMHPRDGRTDDVDNDGWRLSNPIPTAAFPFCSGTSSPPMRFRLTATRATRTFIAGRLCRSS